MRHSRCYFLLILLQLSWQSIATISWENDERDSQIHRQRHYANYSIISMRITEEGQWRLVRQLEEGRLDKFRVDVLRKVPRSIAQSGKRRSAMEVGGDVDMLIAPEHKDALRKLLRQRKIKHYVTADDVEELILKEKKFLKRRRVFGENSEPQTMTVDEYHRFEEIRLYLRNVARAHPEFVTHISIGSSTEGRQLTAIKIGLPNGRNKTGAFLNACMHAREWVACASLIYFINQLTNNSEYRSLLEAMDFYVMPIVNPDGYEFTWEEDRMWRKTRSGPRRGLRGDCYGVDANRNFNFDFGNGDGASDSCGNTYAGPFAFSEPETRALANYLQANKEHISVYLDIHAYSEKLIYPYGNGIRLENEEEIIRLVNNATKAMNEVNGENFQAGSVIDVMYHASGLAIDYMMGALSIPYSFAVELRPDFGAADGFILPPAEIELAAKECWAGLMVIFERAIQTHEMRERGEREELPTKALASVITAQPHFSLLLVTLLSFIPTLFGVHRFH